MADYVVLKRLTLASDLGWFHSVFHGHGLVTKQKAITLTKGVMNEIWPSLKTRQDAYEAAKDAMKVAQDLGPVGKHFLDAEKAKAHAVGTIPIHLELHGPGGKPAMHMERIIALQDKNWRLNGDFIMDPTDDPGRFYPIMQEGDLALIGFDGAEWPTSATVVLISQAADTALWNGLQGSVTKGINPMIQVDKEALLSLSDMHGLPSGHIIRVMAGGPAVQTPASPAVTPSPVAPQAQSLKPKSEPKPSTPPKPKAPIGGPPPAIPGAAGAAIFSPLTPQPNAAPTPKTSPTQLSERLVTTSKTGVLGEQMVDAYLSRHGSPDAPAHNWVSQQFAEHPYDFEMLTASGSVAAVIDAKATSGGWTGEFYMSVSELTYAAASHVPYHIYRLSAVGPMGAELRISGDIRDFAGSIVMSLLSNALAGIRVTGIGIRPVESGIPWSSAVGLPPISDYI